MLKFFRNKREPLPSATVAAETLVNNMKPVKCSERTKHKKLIKFITESVIFFRLPQPCPVFRTKKKKPNCGVKSDRCARAAVSDRVVRAEIVRLMNKKNVQ